jgi:excisionase family DNA binding protein
MSIRDTPEIHSLNPDPLLSIKDAASYLNISVSKMYDIAKQEKLLVVKITSDKKIRKSVLESYIKQHETPWSWMQFN